MNGLPEEILEKSFRAEHSSFEHLTYEDATTFTFTQKNIRKEKEEGA